VGGAILGKTVRIRNEEGFVYRDYSKLYKFAVVLGIIGLCILFVAIFFLVIDSIYNIDTALTLVAVGLCCGIPAGVVLILLVFFHRVQRKQQVEHLYKGGDIETVIGHTGDEELTQNLQMIRDAQVKEQEQFEAEETKLEQEISFLNVEIDEKEQEVIDDLEEERARLLEQKQQLEKDKVESEEFMKRQLESALLGKGQLDIIQAEKVRVIMQLAEKEKNEKERAQRAQQYAETRKENQQIKRALLGRQNIEVLLNKYFVEVAVCFMMDRDAYKDKFGLAPYNRVVNSKTGGEATHIMATTEDRFWRFSEALVDVERFLEHKTLFPAFEKFFATNTPLVLISEKLYYMYLQKNTRKDFVKNYTYKEDFENLLVLVKNNLLLRDNGIDETNWEALGFRNFDDAMYIKEINDYRHGKAPKELVDAVLKKPTTRGKK
jgi:hypothetical protein